MTTPPLVSVVLPTWNSRETLPAALTSLRDQTHAPLEILVVDNGSGDDTVALILRDFPDVQLLRRGHNAGFAPAVNDGISLARGAYILVTNDDVRFDPWAVERLVAALQARPRAGSASCKIYRWTKADEASRILDSTGIMLGLSRMAPFDRGAGEQDDGRYDNAPPPLGPSGAAAMYCRAALGQVAVNGRCFDDGFGSYYEDVDLACRLSKAGYECCFVPKARAWHRRRGPARLSRPARIQAWLNRYAVFARHVPRRELLSGPLLWEVGRLVKTIVREPAMLALLPALWARWRE